MRGKRKINTGVRTHELKPRRGVRPSPLSSPTARPPKARRIEHLNRNISNKRRLYLLYCMSKTGAVEFVELELEDLGLVDGRKADDKQIDLTI